MSTTSLMNLKEEDEDVFPHNVTDLVSHRGVDVSAADVRDLEKRMSPEDYITIMSALNDNTNVNRANVIRGMVGRSGTYSRSSNAGIASQLQRSSQLRDEDIQAAVLHKLRKAINSGDLPLGNMEAFNQWAVSLPHHFIKDVRNAYESMSTQVRQERTSEIADLKLPYQLRELEFDESLQPGKKRIQELEIGKKEHDASMFDLDKDLKTIQLEKSELEKTLKEQQVATGVYTAASRLDPAMEKLKNEQELLINDKTLKAHPDTKPVYIDGVPYYYGWNRKTLKYEPLKDEDGNKLQASLPPADPNKIREFERWVEYENAARKAAGDPLLTHGEIAKEYRDTVLADTTISRPFKDEEQNFSENVIATADSIRQIRRMLGQLQDPEVVIGGVGGFLKGWESIVSQGRQIANLFGQKEFLDSQLYDFGPAAKNTQLHGNITNLAYQLARASEPGGKLNENDVQRQINRIAGSMQSKRSMTAALMEVYNQVIGHHEIIYGEYKRNNVKGTEDEWKDYSLGSGLGMMKIVRQDGMVYVGWELPGDDLEVLVSWKEK